MSYHVKVGAIAKKWGGGGGVGRRQNAPWYFMVWFICRLTSCQMQPGRRDFDITHSPQVLSWPPGTFAHCMVFVVGVLWLVNSQGRNFFLKKYHTYSFHHPSLYIVPREHQSNTSHIILVLFLPLQGQWTYWTDIVNASFNTSILEFLEWRGLRKCMGGMSNFCNNAW